jgi:hypothetical protein
LSTAVLELLTGTTRHRNQILPTGTQGSQMEVNLKTVGFMLSTMTINGVITHVIATCIQSVKQGKLVKADEGYVTVIRIVFTLCFAFYHFKLNNM